ncbi:LysR family transcriptional regulator [Leptobacterium flavescens]|uniref:LysR family transcriptional regulator n=1 Tax=Leptobacterium flavescens TaxID=472055 RepID=A0A6P0UF17_9FLAO|nr:LysR family transcriptional regulator [Leptobacterium flavescens]NER11871.1 LysR family transcriptional regulator [Leptobacterium flavescens]
MDYKIKSRIWVEHKDGMFLGEGRIQLLKAIKSEGSLSKAAASLSMSYKKAWNLMDSMNKSAKEPLVVASTGGKGGGGAAITAYGEKMITAFENINKSCWEFLDSEFKKLEL